MHPGRQKVDVVGPQHIGVDLATRLPGALLQTVDVETVILVRMETRLPAVPARDDMQRNFRKMDASAASHGESGRGRIS